MPKITAQILQDEGYRLEYRGIIQVKGKGQMETFLVQGRKIERTSSLTKSQCATKTMTEVISGMVEVRRKQALSSSLSVPSNKSVRRSPPQTMTTLSLSVPNAEEGERKLGRKATEYLYKRNQNTKTSASFRFRKSPTPHRLNRMMSEMSNLGRSRSLNSKDASRKISKKDNEISEA